ncbi:uncharacterized protein LOC114121840 [Aphis gossypii]|uniref:uncharacterized protein LOC114121840 n=1 Tax=Aphis gossypii TaxID=80765 RepID=UPI002158DB57|nr:uncharacterized protein LOC114121840 [Aphis gossypii]
MPKTILQLSILEHQDDFPDDASTDSYNGLIPYFIVADGAFMMLPNVIRPYPGRSKANLPIDQAVFNYRQNKMLSRTCRCIENTFGIMASKWLIFRQPIIATEETVNAIVQASVVLHNYVKNMKVEKVNE